MFCYLKPLCIIPMFNVVYALTCPVRNAFINVIICDNSIKNTYNENVHLDVETIFPSVN